jgi:cytoskeletal protein CcmA (bactofilin family)
VIFRGESRSAGELNGFLDRGSKIHGEISFEQTFRIDGHLQGSVRSQGELVIGESGVVDGEIEVGVVFISGTVHGKVRASHKIEITPAGRVHAELQAPVLIVEEGAFFEGRCAMQREGAGKTKLESEGSKTVVPLSSRS